MVFINRLNKEVSDKLNMLNFQKILRTIKISHFFAD